MGRRRGSEKPTALGTLHKAYRTIKNCAARIALKNLPRYVTTPRYTEEDIVHQSKVLCRDFIYVRLKENSLLSANEAIFGVEEDGVNQIPCDVAKEIITIASEFEQIYPHLFEDIGTYLKMTYTSTNQVQRTYDLAANEIFRGDITWARVVALFSFTGALTVDCVKQGHGKLGNLIVDCMQKFVKLRLAGWIVKQGGWPALSDHFHQYHSPRWQLWAAGSVGTIVGIILAVVA